MYATEFKTVINEPYIKIPDFEKFQGQEVRVVLLNLNNNIIDNRKDIDIDIDFIEHLINNPIPLPNNFKFNREEANERYKIYNNLTIINPFKEDI